MGSITDKCAELEQYPKPTKKKDLKKIISELEKQLEQYVERSSSNASYDRDSCIFYLEKREQKILQELVEIVHAKLDYYKLQG